MKSFVSYTNCVGTSVWEIYLKPLLPDYEFYAFTNYEMIRNKLPIPVEIVQNADVFMYQPIVESRGIYQTMTEDGILKYLKPSCIRICLPVVGLDMYPCYQDFEHIRGPPIDRSLPLSVLLMNFDSYSMSFGLRERVETGLRHMKLRETMCNVKVSDFIRANYQQYRLFDSSNHPSGMLLAYIANQMLKILGVDKQYDIYAQEDIHVLGDNPHPESEYMRRELGLKYRLREDDGRYRKMLIYIYNHPEAHQPTKTMLLKQ